MGGRKVDRLPPDLRDALEKLRVELEDLGDEVERQNGTLAVAVQALRHDSDRRARWWRTIAVIVAVVLVVLAGLAYTNRLASCGLIRALGTLNEQTDERQQPTPNSIRIGDEADRLGDNVGCSP